MDDAPAPMRPLAESLAELRAVAPDAPLLALGQTIFWDEPMKALVARADPGRRFVAGVHDTDYFAKLPGHEVAKGGERFRAVPHNDGGTRGLWSAAGEFSALFGSETVVTRESLAAAGASPERLSTHALDAATEAWGWRGIVSLDDAPPLARDVEAAAALPTFERTLRWALDESLSCLPKRDDRLAADVVTRLRESAASGATLADAYAAMLPAMERLVAGGPIPVEVTRTSELLRFNRETCGRARFSLARLFVEGATRPLAREFYDDSLAGGGQYELARFGSGAIPFDLVVPGCGRGTIRLGRRGAAIMTREPLFLSFKRPIETLEEFAASVEAKFGSDCALIGKAVTLIGMLAAEFVFVFHAGASAYTDLSLRLHRRLCRELLWCQELHPILRVEYRTWDSLAAVDARLRLPHPLRGPFGAGETTAADFAGRWRAVGEAERERRRLLGRTRRPHDLLLLLESWEPGAWRARLDRYRELQRIGEGVAEADRRSRERIARLYERGRDIRRSRSEAERRRGEHFRAEIFGREPAPDALARRGEIGSEIAALAAAAEEVRRDLRAARREDGERGRDPRIAANRAERRRIEAEAETERLRYAREAVIASDGLAKADSRPAGWWLPLVSPDGAWAREIARTATARLEPLRPPAPTGSRSETVTA